MSHKCAELDWTYFEQADLRTVRAQRVYFDKQLNQKSFYDEQRVSNLNLCEGERHIDVDSYYFAGATYFNDFGNALLKFKDCEFSLQAREKQAIHSPKR